MNPAVSKCPQPRRGRRPYRSSQAASFFVKRAGCFAAPSKIADQASKGSYRDADFSMLRKDGPGGAEPAMAVAEQLLCSFGVIFADVGHPLISQGLRMAARKRRRFDAIAVDTCFVRHFCASLFAYVYGRTLTVETQWLR